jgi:hypothetical protein
MEEGSLTERDKSIPRATDVRAGFSLRDQLGAISKSLAP